MSYLIKSDFTLLITLENLDRITASDDSVWQSGQKSAIEEMAGYLRNRYDVEATFRETVLHDPAIAYTEGARVYTSAGDPLIITHYTAIQDAPENTPITDALIWEAVDSRNSKLITVLLIIILYEIYTRLDASEIPSWLQIRYDANDVRQNGGVIGYLKKVQSGVIQPDIPLRPKVADGTDLTGNRIISGVASGVVDRNTSI